jgi:hypothetical protein
MKLPSDFRWFNGNRSAGAKLGIAAVLAHAGAAEADFVAQNTVANVYQADASGKS